MFVRLFSIILLFIATVLLSANSVYAQTWTKYPTNPVLTPRGNGYWEGNAAQGPSVLKINNVFKVWFSGNNGSGWRIGYAESSDGINSWNISSQSVIPTGSSDGWEKDVAYPSVVYDNDLHYYKMWYVSVNTDHWSYGSDRFRVRYATSSDGINWTVSPGWVLYGSAGKWDEGGIGGGVSVLKINGTYRMWYAATNANTSGAPFIWRIGYATSTDGINWTKQNNGDPVITPTEPWELNVVSGPNVIYENGIYKMWYEAGYNGQYQIDYATSSDGIHWTKPAADNPALTPSTSGFDSVWVGHPSVMNDHGTYKMWYTGWNNQKFTIGLATSEGYSSLPVPLIKQYDLPSGAQIYDSANIWSPSTPFIANWGCALTSATMVLQYYGITTMPDDTPLTPGTLNTWLRSQPDGYIANGLVNWEAISRLTFIAKLAQNNPNLAVDALEYKRVNSTDFAALDADLQDKQPDILEEPGHFIVATGNTGNTYTINDPYYSRTTLADGYNNTFNNIIRYVPTHTDLSYILLVTSPSLTLSLTDSNGNNVGQQYIQGPIEDAKNPGHFSGNPVNIFDYSQPTDGTYTLTISGQPGNAYTVRVYFYNREGNVKTQQISGTLHHSPETYSLTFSKSDESIDDIAGGKPVIAFSNDLELLFQNHLIDSGSYQSLLSVYQNAEKNINNPILAKTLLGTELILLRAKHGHGVTDVAFTILQADIQTLLNNL